MTVRVIGFRTEYLPNGKSRDWVELAPAGDAFDKQRTEHLVQHIIPPDDKMPGNQRKAETYMAMKARWEIVKPRYEAWKNEMEIPQEGTPLSAWSGLTPEMAQYLKSRMGIRTLEELATLSPDHAVKMPFPDARRLPETAARYLEGATAAEKDAEIADMKKKLEALTAALEEKDEQPVKRGPGRPKKSEAA
jgi:hypothetical protein